MNRHVLKYDLSNKGTRFYKQNQESNSCKNIVLQRNKVKVHKSKKKKKKICRHTLIKMV